MKSIDIRSESAIKLLAEFLDMDTQYVAGERHINAEHFAHGPSYVLGAAPILAFQVSSDALVFLVFFFQKYIAICARHTGISAYTIQLYKYVRTAAAINCVHMG
jgi:hypothetical protein